MEFSRQEYWSGLPFSSPGDLPDPGIEPNSPTLLSEPQGKPCFTLQEMLVQSLGQEDPLEKKMASHCSILAWEMPWTEEPGGLQSMGSQKSRT